MRMYRVECNFGSKYFETATKGFAYFKKKKAKHLDVEIWLVNYSYSQKNKYLFRHPRIVGLFFYKST